MNKGKKKDLYIFCLCKIKYLGKKYIYDKLCYTMQFVSTIDVCDISESQCLYVKVSFSLVQSSLWVCTDWVGLLNGSLTVTQEIQVIFTCHSLHPQNPWLIPNGKVRQMELLNESLDEILCRISLKMTYIFLFTFLSAALRFMVSSRYKDDREGIEKYSLAASLGKSRSRYWWTLAVFMTCY